MFIELVDVLRCPRAHQDSWLVLGTGRVEGRDVIEGVLGCPVCRAQYPIAGGVADLRIDPPAPRPEAPAAEPAASSAEQAMRLAAFLNLTDASGYAVLMGEWTRHAAGVRNLADTHLLLVNPVAGTAVGNGVSGVRADGAPPVAAASARALALDGAVRPEWAEAAVAAVRGRGRVLGPVALPLPAGLTELARDGHVWVAEREAAPGPLVALARAGR